MIENRSQENSCEDAKEIKVAEGDCEIDARYSSYVTIYNNLDNLMWKMPAYFSAVIGIFFAVVANIFAKGGGAFSSTLWALLFFGVALMLALGAFGMYRTKFHHSLLEDELRKLEPDGYFHARSLTRKSFSAINLFIIVFSTSSAFLFLAAVSVLIKADFMLRVLGSQIETS